MSAPYYGDFPTSHTAVCMVFDSFAAATGASSATSNFANTDIVIFKDGGTTQRTSAAGITVSTSFDGQVGLQMVTINLSDNTDAGFYAAGHEYQVAVADVTIDTQTVRFWLGSFSIERAGGVLALLKAGSVVVASVTAAGTLTAGERNSIADALLDRTDAVETGLTPRSALKVALAATGGKVSGAATTTNTFRNAVADTKNRIVATVDSDGNRTAITYDLT